MSDEKKDGVTKEIRDGGRELSMGELEQAIGGNTPGVIWEDEEGRYESVCPMRDHEGLPCGSFQRGKLMQCENCSNNHD